MRCSKITTLERMTMASTFDLAKKATMQRAKALPRNGQILIINQATSVSQCLAQSLVRLGYNCTFVDSDNEACILLEHKSFDVIMYSSEHSVVIRPYLCCRTLLYAS